jgi:GH24 family phage-related lysozyme (muramidase)
MPQWIILLGIGGPLAYWLWRKYGNTPPQQFGIDPATGQVVAFDASTPTIYSAMMSFVMNLVPSQGALDFIRQTEALSLVPYHGAADAPGVYTIGYGHKIVAGDPYWPQGSMTAITQDQAESQFESDVGVAADAVRRNVSVVLDQGQFDALTSFFFNLGEYKVMHSGPGGGPSTLMQKLNAGDYAGAAAEFARWVYANGQIQGGLVTRRLAEAATFAGGTA